MTTTTHGYSMLSIVVHWLTVLAVVALFITHEGERGSAMMTFHISGGALSGLFIVWRCLWRPLRGFADKPDQRLSLNLVSSIVMWGLLIVILILTITGYLIPWSLGQPLDLFGIASIPSFLESSTRLHQQIEKVHDVAGHIIIPLFLLHLSGALKHWLIDRDGVMQRMFRSVPGGR